MKRRDALDGMRAVCLYFVMLLHVCSSVWGELPLFTPAWVGATLLRQTWAVPVLVMLTGYLQLDSDRSLRPALGRIARSFAGWTGVYQLYYLCRSWPDPDWKGLAAGLVTGAYHMWYLWMLLGLYLLTPLLRPYLQDRKRCGRFLLLALGVNALTYLGPHIPGLRGILGPVGEMLHLDPGYLGLYVLGFYLGKWPPRGSGVLGWAFLFAAISRLGNLIISLKTGENSEFFTNYLSPSMVPVAAGVFTALGRCRYFSAPVRRLGGLSLQMYLAHALVNEIVVELVGRSRLAARPVWMLPAAGLVFLGSLGVALGLEWCNGHRHRCSLGGRV